LLYSKFNIKLEKEKEEKANQTKRFSKAYRREGITKNN
jgi:hypothetical protein